MNILLTTSSFSMNKFPESLNIIHNPYERRLTEEEAAELVDKYQPVGIIAGVEPLTRKVMNKAKNLKVISRCGIGLDSVDLDAAKEMGIKVVNTPDAPTVPVAELTIGLMLGIARRINTVDRLIRQGGWKGPSGVLLKDKTLGIIGCGRIGTYVSRLASAFGCKILGYDPYVKQHDICKMVSLEDIIRDSDIITLHIPYTKENRHIIGEKQIDRMKNTVLLINTGRGGLIDEEALYKALKSGKIAGAALDCFENEPYSGPLTELDNVILSAHMGTNAVEARIRMEQQAMENLLKELDSLGML